MPANRRLRPAHIVVMSIVGVVLLPSIPGGAFWAVLTLLALGAAIFGVVAIFRGRLRWLGIRNRGVGAAVVAASLCLMVVGATTNAALNPVSTTPAAFVADARGQMSSPPSPTPTSTPLNVLTEVVELVPIPFAATEVEDPNIDLGQVIVTTIGIVGEQKNTYRVTTRAGVEVSRELVSQVVSIAPVTQVTSRGTRQPPPPPAPIAEPAGGGCDPNYEGQCVPIASDVDCAGGSGNGPAYTPGPVYVIGSDIYDLDRDGDGIACD